MSVIEQRVEIGDSRSSRSRGRGIPILYRYADLLGIGVVGRINIHGVAVILRRGVKPVLLGGRGGETNHLRGISSLESLVRTRRGHPLEGKSCSLQFLSGGSTCSRADRRGRLKVLIADIASKETSRTGKRARSYGELWGGDTGWWGGGDIHWDRRRDVVVTFLGRGRV